MYTWLKIRKRKYLVDGLNHHCPPSHGKMESTEIVMEPGVILMRVGTMTYQQAIVCRRQKMMLKQKTVYFREEDLPLWEDIENKAQFLHDALSKQDYSKKIRKVSSGLKEAKVPTHPPNT